MALPYPPFQVQVATPRLRLLAVTEERVEALLPLVQRGLVVGDELPYDDPSSFYEESPLREWRWLQAMWRARTRVSAASWRLNFAVEVDGELVGMQDLLATEFDPLRSVSTFSWLAPEARGHGIGRETRAAILHLAFAGFDAREATSDAFVDNRASNAVSRALGYAENGFEWATRKGQPAQLQRWVLDRPRWEQNRRSDITLSGVEECKAVFGLA